MSLFFFSISGQSRSAPARQLFDDDAAKPALKLLNWQKHANLAQRHAGGGRAASGQVLLHRCPGLDEPAGRGRVGRRQARGRGGYQGEVLFEEFLSLLGISQHRLAADYRRHRGYGRRAMPRWHRAVAAGLDFRQWAALPFP